MWRPTLEIWNRNSIFQNSVTPNFQNGRWHENYFVSMKTYFPTIRSRNSCRWSVTSANNYFDAMPLADFWAKPVHIYKRAGRVTTRICLPFSPNYLWGSGLSTLVIKRQDLEIHCVWSRAELCIFCYIAFERLFSKQQLHPSECWKLLVYKLLLCPIFVDFVLGWGTNFIGKDDASQKF